MLGIQVAEELPNRLLSRLDTLYSQLDFKSKTDLIPTKQALIESLERCSFKKFADPVAYLESFRAKNAPQCISSDHGEVIFRVFFNAYSNKIYVDLNLEAIARTLDSGDTEKQLLCEIIRSILFIRPDDTTPEVSEIDLTQSRPLE